MADFTRTVDLVFGGKDNVSPTIRSITRSLDDFDNRVEALAEPFGRTADAVLKVETAILALGATAIAFSTGQAITFEAALLDLDKVLLDSEGSAEDYADQIRQLALFYGESSTEVVNSAANFKQANFTIAESFNLVEASLVATKISELDANEASKLLISTIKGFGYEASEVTNILDTWNETSNLFAVNTQELAVGLAEISGISRTAGLDINELTSYLVPIIEVFGSGSEAARALRTGLLRLTDDNPTIVAALEAVGVAQFDANGQLRQSGDILEELVSKWQNVEEAERGKIAADLFGKEQALRLLQVLERENTVLDVQSALFDKAGSAQREFENRMKATEVAIQRLVTGLGVLSASIGGEFLDGTKGSVEALSELVAAFQQVVDTGGLDELFNAVQPLFAQFQEDVRAVAKALPEAFEGLDFTGLLDALGGLGDEVSDVFSAIFGDLDLTKAEDLTVALQKAVNLVENLTRITTEIIDTFGPVFQAIGEVATRTGDLSTETAESVGQLLAAGKAITDFGAGLGAALLVIKGTGTDVGNVFDAIVGSLKILINGAQVAFDLFAATVFETLASIVNDAASVLNFISLGLADDTVANLREKSLALQKLADTAAENLVRNGYEARDGLAQIGRGFGFAADEAEQQAPRITGSIKDISDSTDEAITKFGDYTLEVKEGFGSIEDAANGLAAVELDPEALFSSDFLDSLDQAEQGVGSVAEATGSLAGELDSSLNSFRSTEGAAESLGSTLDDTAATIDEGAESSGQWVRTLEDGVPTFRQVGDAADEGFGKAKRSAEDAEKAADEVFLKLIELASDERIRSIELAVDLNIAKLESDTKIATEIINTLNTGIESTGDLLGNLFGLLESDNLAFNERVDLKKQIELERQFREQQFEQQEKLINAQIEMMEARTDALERGDGLITIKADGLEPELRAFMMKILQLTQIEMADDEQLFLLGAGTA